MAKILKSSKENDHRGKIKSDFPKHDLEDAISVPRVIEEKNGGRPMPPTDLAIGLGMSPGSSNFRVLLSSSLKYGLTKGSFVSERISLADLGTRICVPKDEGDLHSAQVVASLSPATFASLYAFFKGKKLPDSPFFENAIVREFAVPKEKASECAEVFTKNMEKVGLIRIAATGKWLSIEPMVASLLENGGEASGESGHADAVAPSSSGTERSVIPDALHVKPKLDLHNRRVFVTHGKNKGLLPQLKDLLVFGQFEPIVSIERESVSKPVPDKVLDDMRLCGAAIIHVDADRELLSPEGQREIILNPNVLIEIGAAMALYRRRFILLVQNGVRLPSNLQGLYEVRYEGEKLDGEATLKLLKAFNDFRNTPEGN